MEGMTSCEIIKRGIRVLLDTTWLKLVDVGEVGVFVGIALKHELNGSIAGADAGFGDTELELVVVALWKSRAIESLVGIHLKGVVQVAAVVAAIGSCDLCDTRFVKRSGC